MKHKTIKQLRDSLQKVLKHGRPRQLNKLRKAYHGKRLNEWWCDYAKADGHFTIAQLKDFEGVGHRIECYADHSSPINYCPMCGRKLTNQQPPEMAKENNNGKY